LLQYGTSTSDAGIKGDPVSFDRYRLMQELTRDEGRKLRPYTDMRGRLTIGVGRNLTDVGISEAECDMLLGTDIDYTSAELDQYLPWWRTLDGQRQRVLLNMTFHLGITRVLRFEEALAAVQAGNWEVAAKLLLSIGRGWTTVERAKRLSQAMSTGVMPA
jgi:lysozyme